MKDRSEYNSRFQQLLRQNHPVPFTRIENCEYEGLAYFRGVIEHSDPRRVIVLSNYGAELTVFIDAHHAHFGESGSTIDEDFREAMYWIRDVMEGLVYIISTFLDKKLVGNMSAYSVDNIVTGRGERVEVLRYPDVGVREIAS